MLDINKLRNAYNIVHRISIGKNPFADEELTLEVVQSKEVQEALGDAAEVIAVYGKIMNLMTQSTSFAVASVKNSQEQFAVSAAEAALLQPAEMPQTISYITKNINENIPAVANEKMRKLTAVGLGRWLMSVGYLQMSDNGKNKVATEKGVELGIVTEKRVSQYSGEYYANYYSPSAQQFIFEHLQEAAEFLAKEKEEKNLRELDEKQQEAASE